VSAFRGGPEIEDYLVRARRILRALGGAVARRLRDAGVFVPEPEGAFYLFPDFDPLRAQLGGRGIKTSDALCERLLEEEGIALLPGSVFGRPPAELTARIAYVDFDGSRALEAARERDLAEPFLREHCDSVITAADRIGAWLAGR
jgi:aspartate aminotransferase